MNETTKKSKSKFCTTKRLKTKLTMIVTHFFDTVWATGASVAAAMVISTSFHSREARLSASRTLTATSFATNPNKKRPLNRAALSMFSLTD